MPSSRSTSLARRAARKVKRLLRPPLHRPDGRARYRVLGSDYGGWPVIDGSLHPASRVYSVGVGQDISFDLAVIERFGCAVEAFDPTPRCVAWVDAQEVPERFRFHPLGLSDRTEVLRFAAPPEQDFVSYTVGQRDDSPEVVELPVRALDELMEALGDTALDFLKMDIEGSEYVVIDDMVAKSILPPQLCIEFHHGMFGYTDRQTREAVEKLRAAGYRLHYVSDGGHEYGFHREERTDA